jgi:hypothetical protein
MANFFEALFDGSAAPVMASIFGDDADTTWGVGIERVTAIQLPSGVSYSALFHEHQSEMKDDQGTISNTIHGKLWVPTTAKPVQRSMWRIIRSDGTETDFTGSHHGERSGGFLCVDVEQVTVSKFTGAFGR